MSGDAFNDARHHRVRAQVEDCASVRRRSIRTARIAVILPRSITTFRSSSGGPRVPSMTRTCSSTTCGAFPRHVLLYEPSEHLHQARKIGHPAPRDRRIGGVTSTRDSGCSDPTPSGEDSWRPGGNSAARSPSSGEQVNDRHEEGGADDGPQNREWMPADGDH